MNVKRKEKIESYSIEDLTPDQYEVIIGCLHFCEQEFHRTSGGYESLHVDISLACKDKKRNVNRFVEKDEISYLKAKLMLNL